MFDQECIKDAINRQYGIGGYCKNDINEYCMIGTKDALRKYSKMAPRVGADFDGDIVCIYGIKEEKEMNNNSKVVTLIGSMSEVNKAAMMALYNRLTYKGHIVRLPYMERVPEDASDEQIEILHDLHKEKMVSADLIIVVDADGHIGKDTRREINWCVDYRKNLIYLSDMQVYEGDEKQTKGGKK